MNILYLITARGGSKGIPKKNIQKISGIPLVAYKAISAQKCKYTGRIMVSTDDEEIMNVCKQYDVDVPFIRPQHLSQDDSSSIDVVLHAMQWIEKHDSCSYDYIFLLEPSSPFATYTDFNNSLDIIINSDADTLLSMRRVDVNRVFINNLDQNGGLSYFHESIQNLKYLHRQAQNQEYTPNGCIYISKWNYMKQNKSFHSKNSKPYLMKREYSLELDETIDLEFAKFLVKKNIIDISSWK